MSVILMFGVKLRKEGILGFFRRRDRIVFCVRLPQELVELPVGDQWNCSYEYGVLPTAPTIMNCGEDAVVKWENNEVRVTTQHFELSLSKEQIAREEFSMDVELNGRRTPIRVVQFEDD